MTAARRSDVHDPDSPASAKSDHVGGDLLVAVAFLVAFLAVCLFTLASFVVGFFGR